jgi:hypothetical protein
MLLKKKIIVKSNTYNNYMEIKLSRYKIMTLKEKKLLKSMIYNKIKST